MGLALLLLPHEIRREYSEALECVPHLVASESKVIDILRTERWDPFKAATRLALYWKYRSQLFGDRWLLPMTQTGLGALSRDDIQILRTGYMAPIWQQQQEQNHDTDHSNRRPAVVLADRSRLPRTAGIINTRLQFYFATIFTNEQLQTEGFIIIQVITSDRRPALETDPDNWKILGTACPMRIRGILIGQAYEEGKERLIETYADEYKIITEYKTGKTIPMVKGFSSREIYDLFHRYVGVDRNHLPPCLGGSYQYNEFVDWVTKRLTTEAGTVLVPRPVLSSRRLISPAVNTLMGTSLQDKAKFLRQDNQRLRMENLRLEEALDRARQVCDAVQLQDSESICSEIALHSKPSQINGTFKAVESLLHLSELETTPAPSPFPEEIQFFDPFDCITNHTDSI